jgi:hypothetical protein
MSLFNACRGNKAEQLAKKLGADSHRAHGPEQNIIIVLVMKCWRNPRCITLMFCLILAKYSLLCNKKMMEEIVLSQVPLHSQQVIL